MSELDNIPYVEYNQMSWEIEYTDEFGAGWTGLSDGQQEDVTAVVELLLEHGPRLPFPLFL